MFVGAEAHDLMTRCFRAYSVGCLTLADVGGHRDVDWCISARSDDTVLQTIIRRMLRHLTLDVKFDFAHIGKQLAAVAFSGSSA